MSHHSNSFCRSLLSTILIVALTMETPLRLWSQAEHETVRSPSPAALRSLPMGAMPLGASDPTHFHRHLVELGGSFHVAFQDISIAARGWPLELARVYRSDRAEDTGLGSGWGWTYGVRLHLHPDSADAVILEADGTRTRYEFSESFGRPVAGRMDSILRQLQTGNRMRIFADGGAELFDWQGRLMERLDEFGRALTIEYQGNVPSRVTDVAGRSLEFDFVEGHLAKVTDPLGRVINYQYDARGRLAKTVDALHRTTSFFYDDHGITTLDMADSQSLRISYDDAGRVAGIDGPGPLHSTFTHEISHAGDHLSMTSTDGNGNSITQEINTDTKRGTARMRLVNAAGEASDLEYQRGTLLMRQAGDPQAALELDRTGTPVRLRDHEGNTHDLADLQNLAAPSNWHSLNPDDYDLYGYARFLELEGMRVAITHDVAGRMTSLSTLDGEWKETFEYDFGDRLIAHVDHLGREESFVYDAADRLILRRDYFGKVATYEYDERGNLTRYQPTVGREIYYEYDAACRLTKIREGIRELSFTFDSADRLLALKDERGHVHSLEYDSSGRLVAGTSPRGENVAFEYDAHGIPRVFRGSDRTIHLDFNLEDSVVARDSQGWSDTLVATDLGTNFSTVSPMGKTATLTHTVDGLVSSLQADGSHIEAWKQDQNGRLVEHSVGERSTSYQYDDRGDLIKEKLPTGLEIVYQRDKLSRLRNIGNGDNAGIETEYDDFGRRSRVTEPGGRSVRYAYDDFGRTAEIVTGKQRVELQYNSLGLISTVLLDNRGELTFEYDDYDRLIEYRTNIDDSDCIWKYGYDDSDQLTSITGPDGTRQSLEYDEVGRLVRQVSGGSTIQIGYDLQGRVVTIEEDGVTQSIAYDDDGRPIGFDGLLKAGIQYLPDGITIQASDPEGGSWHYANNLYGQLASITNPLGGITKYDRNQTGDLLAISDPGQRRLVYERDALGRLVSFGPADGPRERYLADKSETINQIVRPDGTTISRETSQDGRRVVVRIDDTIHATYDFDELGKMVSAAGEFGVHRFEYDKQGRLVKATDPFGKVLTYQYGKTGQRAALVGPQGEIVKYQYGTDGRVAEVIGPDAERTRYTRDATGRVTQVDLAGGATATVAYTEHGTIAALQYSDRHQNSIAERTFEADARGNLSQLGTGNTVWKFESDLLGRLTSAAGPGLSTERFQYDGSQNITRFGTSGNFVVNDYFQLESIDDRPVQHDANGNLTRMEGRLELDYDSFGHVTHVDRPNQPSAEYRYDVFGRLKETRTAGQTVRYLYDGNKLVAAYDGQGRRLAWIERGADGPETARIHTADQVATMLVDHLGSPIAEVNDAEQIQQFIYSPWGTLQNPKETENLHLNLIGYMGLPNDSARGLVFTGARAYLPEIGRFVSPDPANVALGANPYAYANNNPLTYYDRDGFAPTSPFDPSSMSKNELRKLRLQHQIIRILKVQPLDSAYSNILVDTLQRGLATNADLVPVVTSFRGFPGETRRGGARRVGSRLIGGVLHDRFEIVIDPNKVVGVHSQISTLAHEVRHTFQDYSRPYTVLSEVQPHLDQWVLANHSRGIPAGTQHDRLMQMFSNLEANYTHLGEVFDPLESPRRETRFGQPTTVYRTPKPEVVAEVVERFRELRPGLVTPHSGPIELAGPHPSVNSAANRLRHLQTRGGPPTVQPAAANAASAASATRPSGPSRTTGQANAGRSPGVSKLPASNPSIGETPRPATSGARPTAERGGTIRSSQPGRATPPRSPSEASGTRSSPGRSATSARPGPSASAKAPYRTVPVTGGRSSPTSTRGGRASATTSPKPQIGRTQRPTNLNHANRRTVRTRPPVRPTAIDPPGAGRPFAAVALSWGFRAIFAYTLFDIGRRVVTGRSTPGQGALDLVNLVVPVRDYLDGRLTLSETVAFATGGALIMLGSTTAVTIGAVLIAPILGKIIGNALAALVINEIRSNSPLGKLLRKFFEEIGWINNGDPTFVAIPEPDRTMLGGPRLQHISPGITLASTPVWFERRGSVRGTIQDESGKTIQSLGRLSSERGILHVHWDGTNERGEPAHQGIYRLTIDQGWSDDGRPLHFPDASCDVLVDSSPPNFRIENSGWKGRDWMASIQTNEPLNLCLAYYDASDRRHSMMSAGATDGSQIAASLPLSDVEAVQTFEAYATDAAGNAAVATIDVQIPPLDPERVVDDVRIGASVKLIPVRERWSSADQATAWLSGNTAEEAELFGDWKWPAETVDPFGADVHVSSGDGPQIHYMLLPRANWFLAQDDNIIQYLKIDPAQLPSQILIQVYADGLDGEHRASLGESLLAVGDASSTVNMGKLPPSGLWHRWKIPAELLGLGGRPVQGILFATYGGRVMWGTTTTATSRDDSPVLLRADSRRRLFDSRVDLELSVHPAAAGRLQVDWITAHAEEYKIFDQAIGRGERIIRASLSRQQLQAGGRLRFRAPGPDDSLREQYVPYHWEDPSQQLTARIDFPPSGALGRQTVPVFGQAGGANFDRYVVDYRIAGTDDNSWTTISESRRATSIEQSSIQSIIDQSSRGALRSTIYGNLASLDTGSANHRFEFRPAVDPVSPNRIEVRLRCFALDGAVAEDRIELVVGEVADNLFMSTIVSPDGGARLVLPPLSLPSEMGTLAIERVAAPKAPKSYGTVISAYRFLPGGIRLLADARFTISAENPGTVSLVRVRRGHWQPLTVIDSDQSSATCLLRDLPRDSVIVAVNHNLALENKEVSNAISPSVQPMELGNLISLSVEPSEAAVGELITVRAQVAGVLPDTLRLEVDGAIEGRPLPLMRVFDEHVSTVRGAHPGELTIRVLGSTKSVAVVDRTPPQNPLPTLATEKAVVQVSTSEASRLTKMVPRFSFHAGVPGRNEPQVFIGQQFDLAKSSELSFRYRLQPGSVSQLLVRRADRVEVIPLSGPSPHGGGGCRVLPHQALRDDGQWHGAHISLASLMGREGKIEHIMVGRVRSPGWRMMRVGGLGSADYLDVDDVRLGPAWPTSAVDVISLDYPDDDVAAIRWSINDEPMATPLTKAIGRPLTLPIGKRGAGRYFLHLSACDRSGNWSTPAHWPLQIDVDPPTASDPLPAPDAAAAEMMVSIRLRDVGTGIDSESIQLRVAGMNVPPDRIRFDGDTGIASVALGELPHRPRVEAGTELTATLVSVADRAGNKLAAPFSWNWTFAPQLLSTGKARMLTTDGGFDATWSVDGERIIFVSDQGGQVDLYQLELASKAISQLTDNQEAESSPQLSPDGQWLAFLKSSRLILLNLQTGQEKSLGEVDGVTWRSEREMLVTRGNRLLTKTLAGDESIVDTLGAGGHILRPRGSSHLCAFTHRVYHQSVWVRSQSRGTTHPLSTNLGDPSLREYDANVSPDKQWIAFASGGRLPGLWLVRPDGTDRTRILPATSPGDRRPSWSPNGETLVFDSNRNGVRNLWLLDLGKPATISVEPRVYSYRQTEPQTIRVKTAQHELLQVHVETLDGQIVRELFANQIAGPEVIQLDWDGKDGEHSPLDQDEYSLVVQTSSDAGTFVARSSIYLDNQPPTTRAVREGDGREISGLHPLLVGERVVFEADDGPSGIGVDRIEYRASGSQNWLVADGPITPTELGGPTIEYRAVDHYGQAEPQKILVIDATTGQGTQSAATAAIPDIIPKVVGEATGGRKTPVWIVALLAGVALAVLYLQFRRHARR